LIANYVCCHTGISETQINESSTEKSEGRLVGDYVPVPILVYGILNAILFAG